jgi:tagatose 6-phosphate kinase
VEESKPVALESYDKLLQTIRTRVSGCKAVVMSGTLTPSAPADFYFETVRIAVHYGALAVVDAHGPPLIEALRAKPDLVKPNRTELEATAGRNLAGEPDLLKAMREVIERGAKNVAVTAGKSPTLASDGKNCWRILNPQIEVINPIGSGDAFTAGVLHRLVRGDGLGEACRWGAACGAANALNLMAGEVEREDVERLVKGVRVENIL